MAQLHEHTAQAVIRLFKPDADQRVDRLHTSLRQLSHATSAEVESVRAAVSTLVANGDFRCSLDVDTARDEQAFDLAVDWELFRRSRIGISSPGSLANE